MIKLTLFLVALIVVVGVSSLTYSKLGVFNFAGGSDSTLRVVRSSPWIIAAVSFTLLAWLVFFIWHSQSGVAQLVILAVLLMMWIISGRVIGVFPDGRIVAGWFFFSTTVLDFRDHDEDHEFHVLHTQILPSSGWVVETRSHGQRARIFVGPILQNSLLGLLKERGFDVRLTTEGTTL